MMELLEKGGFMMYPILLSSIIALGVIIERFYVVFLQAVLPRQNNIEDVFKLSQEGRIKEAIAVIETEPDSLNNLLLVILNESDEAHQEKAATLAGNEILFHLRARLSILSAIGTAAPLMGLLGTVFGMIEVFSNVSSMQGATDPTILANGIWTALLTTAAGMSVAIPCVLTYHFLDRKIKNMAHHLQFDGNRLIHILNHLPLQEETVTQSDTTA